MEKLFTAILFLGFLFSFTSFAPVAEANGGLVKVVDTKTTIVREEANGSSKKLLTLSKGYYVTQLSTGKGWAKVKAGKTTGYVKVDALKVKDFNRKAISGSTNLQQTASKSATTLTKIQKGIVVENFGSAGNGWSFIKYDDVTGYVPTKSLKALTSVKKYLKESEWLNILPMSLSLVSNEVQAGTKVTVLSTVGKYSYVKANDKYGYVLNSDLVTHMAFAPTYMPKCENVKSEVFKCETKGFEYVRKNFKGTYLYPSSDESLQEYYQQYYLDGDNLNFTFVSHNTARGSTLYFPLYKGKTWTYGDAFDLNVRVNVISVNETVRSKGKILKNVIKLEILKPEYSPVYSYLAPGYGYILLDE